MSDTAVKFWNWFKENQQRLSQINDPDLSEEVTEELLDSILENLQLYCDHLYFDIGGIHGELQEFIVTAEGNLDYFKNVEELIEYAPVLEGWVFIPFMPLRDLDYTSVFEDVELKPMEIWFLPLDNKNNSKSIGIRICLPNYDSVVESKWMKNAVYKVLDIALGEKSFALDIQYLEIKPMPLGNPEDNGLIELKEIAAFIKWQKAKLAAV